MPKGIRHQPALNILGSVALLNAVRAGYTDRRNVVFRIFPNAFIEPRTRMEQLSPPQDESACDGSTRRTPVCFAASLGPPKQELVRSQAEHRKPR